MEIWFGDKVGFLTKTKIYAMSLYEWRAKKRTETRRKGQDQEQVLEVEAHKGRKSREELGFVPPVMPPV